MFPHKLIWIAVGRIGRQKKQPQFAAQSFNEGFRLLRTMRGSTIDNEKDRPLGARDQAFQELDKTAALTPPFSLIMNRMWPREVIAEIRLMLWRAPVAATIGVSPRLPQLRPAW